MAEARVTQVAVEVLYKLNPPGRVSQVAVEVLRKRPTFVPQIYRRR